MHFNHYLLQCSVWSTIYTFYQHCDTHTYSHTSVSQCTKLTLQVYFDEQINRHISMAHVLKK